MRMENKCMAIDNIKKMILKDLREDDLFQVVSCEEKDRWEISPQNRIDIYNKYKGKINNRDAERWDCVLKFYQRYACFNNSQYKISKDFYICFKKENSEVRIQADVLTNVEAVKVHAAQYENLSCEEKAVLDAFYKVSYTIGAFCPIWKNPGGNKKADIIWNKLLYSGLYELCGEHIDETKLICDYQGIDIRKECEKLTSRKKENLFMILPKEENKKTSDVMSDLYFMDYFDSNWRRRRKINGLDELKNKSVFIEFIKQLTILIVQRSYRILTDYRGNILRDKDKDVIIECLKEVGLNCEKGECIYSHKGV